MAESSSPSSSESPLCQGAVLSDLHLFSRRSDGDHLFERFAKATAADIDTLVLNGDTFDFRWSQLPSEEHSIQAALAWVESLLDSHPRWTVHYLLGNHDCLASFRDPLETFADRHPRLQVHEHRLRLGSHLFLHGDCANYRMDGKTLARFRDSWSRDRQRSRFAARLYAASDALPVSRQFHQRYFPEDRASRRVAYHLDQVIPGWAEQITHCYFGHTHHPFSDHRHDGVRFFNTGSAIRNMGFRPLRFAWADQRQLLTTSLA